MILILYLLFSMPLYHEDKPGPEKTAQLVAIAHAVHKERLTLEQMAFLLAWGEFETHYSLRIHAGECRKWECDPIVRKGVRTFRARGPWQSHTRELPVGVEWSAAQVADAARRVRWALRECRGDVAGAYAVLGGRGCARAGERQHTRARRVDVLLARARGGVPTTDASRLRQLLQPGTSSEGGRGSVEP
jgi:hypothetical protein